MIRRLRAKFHAWLFKPKRYACMYCQTIVEYGRFNEKYMSLELDGEPHVCQKYTPERRTSYRRRSDKRFLDKTRRVE